ncbi:putative MFS family arabinose efflux permease [Hydrogenivirga caldilitoris]|uniref:Putative MFS family arabinose efflux permease n=1 Tax=Hydrogenivirga caldilitoris TaxID=246264 RepID=A0A497XSQ2_9AQUI|nr:MFS transporter [Hydrogenivirga caldilitoris]RLJ71190.1 putative MFS family arabinose efflux permease [Hydrogenivirga caldilitoris]
MRLIETDITCRLDALPWSWFHTKFLLALGITWVLDAFEVVIVGNVLGSMTESLNLNPFQASLVISGFLAGAIIGSFLFGYLADRFGRKRVFLITLFLYSFGTFLTGFAWDFYSAFFLRVLAGAGIGGEFAAIHSAIDEFIPARHRGKVDGFVVASWNIGSLLASVVALFLLENLSPEWGWRFAFFLGGVIALLIVWVRRSVPESPRWLLSKGKKEKAEEIVEELEREAGVVPVAVKCPVPVFEGSLVDGLRFIMSRYTWRFVFASSLSLTILTTYYGLVSLLPISLAPSMGIPSEDVPNLFLIGSVGGFFGGVVVSIFSDLLGRKTTGLGVALLSALSTLTLVHLDNFYTAFAIYSFIAFSFASVAYVSAIEIFPSFIRATAVGLISIIGRLGGVMAPPLLVSVSQFGYTYGIYGLFSLWLVGVLAFLLWSLFGIEAKGKSIEEIT